MAEWNEGDKVKTPDGAILVLSGGAWVPEKKAQPIAGDDVARSALSGLTLGFGDELTGAVVAPIALATTGSNSVDRLRAELGEIPPITEPGLTDIYASVRDQERASTDRFRQEHPGAAIASELAGGILTGVAGGGRLAGTQIAKNVAASSLPKRMAAASAVGGGTGAIAGAGEAKDMRSVPGEALKSAAIGAVIGPVMEGGVTALQTGAKALSPQRAAERSVRKAVQRGEMTLPQVQAKLKKMGPGAVLADVNEGVLTELDRLTSVPGATRTKAIRQLGKRSGEQVDEILNATGKGQYFENLDAAKNIKQQVAAPLYQSAYAKGVPHTKELDDIFNGLEEALPGAWKEAKKYGELDLLGKGDVVPDLGDAVPSLRGWQAVKEYLDDRIGGLMRSGEEGKAGKLIGVKNRLLKELDALNSDYGEARNLWAGVKSFENKMQEGLSFMRPGISASKLKHELKDFSSSDRLAFREGARQAIQDVMEKAGDTHDASKFFRNPAMRGKLREIFGRKESAKILRTIETSSAKQRSYSRVSGNSLTALRNASQEEEGLARDAMGALSDFAFSNPTQAGASILRRVGSKLPTSRESTRNTIGEMLLENDPAKRDQILQWLMQGGKPLPQSTGAGLVAPAVAGAAGGILSSR